MKNANHKPPVVTASDVGKAAYCPYSLYLAARGAKVSSESKARIRRGSSSHRSWDKSRDDASRKSMPNYIKIFILAMVVMVLYLLSR